jgi:hypothetical protein
MNTQIDLKTIYLSDNQKLWRYMDISKFISMLHSKAIWLARADTVKDKHEGRFPDDMRQRIKDAYRNLPDTDKSPVKDTDDFQDYLVKNTFISCWHKNFDENMVMWEIYGRDNSSLAVQTTVGQIRSNTDTSKINGYSLIMKDIDYKNADEIQDVIKYEECFFRKRRHYAYEEEVRISLDTYNKLAPTKNTPCGHLLSCKLNQIIGSILVHPDCKDWFLDVVNSICKKYEIRASVSRGKYGSI